MNQTHNYKSCEWLRHMSLDAKKHPGLKNVKDLRLLNC